MKKLLVLASMSMITSLFDGCGPNEAARTASSPTPAPSNQMVIVGSTTLQPVAQKAVDAFRKRKPEIQINLTGGGSQIGINALVDGISDIAMSSRELKEEEKEKLRKKRMEAKGHIVAWDGIGYDGIDYVDGAARVKSVSVDGVKASAGAVSDRSYKIARPIYMFTRGNPSALVVEFLDFVLSPEGQALVKEAKFAPVPQK